MYTLIIKGSNAPMAEKYSTKANLIMAIGEWASEFGFFTELYLDNKLVYLNPAIVEWAEMGKEFLKMENWINSQDFTKAAIG